MFSFKNLNLKCYIYMNMCSTHHQSFNINNHWVRNLSHTMYLVCWKSYSCRFPWLDYHQTGAWSVKIHTADRLWEQVEQQVKTHLVGSYIMPILSTTQRLHVRIIKYVNSTAWCNLLNQPTTTTTTKKGIPQRLYWMNNKHVAISFRKRYSVP